MRFGVCFLVMLFVLFFRSCRFPLGSFRRRCCFFRLRFTTPGCFSFGFGVG
jgi:hypothetical protein